MKSMKEYLTGIGLCAALFIAGGCTNENEITGNSGGNGNGTPVPLTIRATAGNFGGLPETGKSDAPLTRTPTEDGSTTKFNAGDAIGIFAIKDGKIVDGISNTRLTYSDASGTGSWEPASGTTLYYYEGISYIAYYPYKDGIGIDASQNTDVILASLADNDGLQPVADQSNTGGSDYTNSDLMTACGTPENGNTASEKILTLDFKHQFSLLILVLRASVECIAPADGGFVYRTGAKVPIPNSDASKVTLNGFTPFKVSEGSYRVIVKPTTNASTLNGNYKTKDNRTINYEGNSYTAGFAAGYCYTLDVDSPLPAVATSERPLAPGDFVFQNESEGRIEIYPGNGLLVDGKIPDYDNAVGIVVTCDENRMTDDGCNTEGWNHAYVMGLEDVTGGPLGPFAATNGLESIPRAEAKDHMIGYCETNIILKMLKDMLEIAKGDEAKVEDIGKKYSAFYNFNIYRSNNPVPTPLENVRSTWFIPSCGQLYDMLKNLCGKSPDDFRDSPGDYWVDYNYGPEMCSKINNQLEKVNKVFVQYDENRKRFKEVFFWSVSQHSTPTRAWCCTFGISPNGPTSSLLGPGNKDTGQATLIRPFFAF